MPSANTLNMQHEALEHNFPPADVAAYDPRLAETLREHDGTLAATAEVVGEHDVTLGADGRPVVATDTTTPLGAAEASDPNALDNAEELLNEMDDNDLYTEADGPPVDLA